MLSTEEVLQIVWETISQLRMATVILPIAEEALLAECVNNVLKRALIAGSDDNVSALIVSFKVFI